ncbi:hypothetical protein [Sporosarcina sp. SAFN-015]|uniref:hypothetical protein n=1 Tax=Sporosarcina sp. SAFN-015 TaxID=3387274 RepID=UPI003F7EC37F
MTNYTAGADALNALNRSDDAGTANEFTSFKSGTTFFVKALGTADLIQFFSYGIFNKVNSFVADKPSKKSAKGYPVDDLTVWDRAWKHHKDLSQEFNDYHGQEASKYRCKERFAMGFYDLTTGELIVIDVSKKQAQAIHAIIVKNEKRLDKMAFELSKQGSGTSTTVSLSPVMFPDEDLTDVQRANLDKAPDKFDMSRFDGILFEADEKQQIENLIQAGFDIALIGLERPAIGESASTNDPFAQGEGPIEVSDDDLPF